MISSDSRSSIDALHDSLSGQIEVEVRSMEGRLRDQASLSENAQYSLVSHCVERAAMFLLPTFAVKLAAIKRELVLNPKACSGVSPASFGENAAAESVSDGDARLERAAQLSIEHSIGATESAIRRIAAFLGKHPAPDDSPICIAEIVFPDSSDAHNNGQKVMVFDLESYGKLVYKPVNLLPLKLFNHVLEQAIARAGLGKPVVADVVYSAQDYGISRFVPLRQEISLEEQASAFYKRFGTLMACAHLLQITDLHFENLLASDGSPVAIDVETLAYPQIPEFQSIESTGLIGEREFAAVTGGGEYVALGISEVVRANDSLEVEYRSPHWSANNRIMFRHNGTLVEPEEFIDDVAVGFRKSYCHCRDMLPKVPDLISSFSKGCVPRYRIILRPTAFYMMLVLRSVQPDVHSDRQARESLREKLVKGPTLFGHAINDRVIEAEISDILIGDIPYFYSQGTSLALWHRGDVASRDYFKDTPVQRLQRVYELSGSRDQDKQIELIKEHLTSGAQKDPALAGS